MGALCLQWTPGATGERAVGEEGSQPSGLAIYPNPLHTGAWSHPPWQTGGVWFTQGPSGAPGLDGHRPRPFTGALCTEWGP